MLPPAPSVGVEVVFVEENDGAESKGWYKSVFEEGSDLFLSDVASLGFIEDGVET